MPDEKKDCHCCTFGHCTSILTNPAQKFSMVERVSTQKTMSPTLPYLSNRKKISRIKLFYVRLKNMALCMSVLDIFCLTNMP